MTEKFVKETIFNYEKLDDRARHVAELLKIDEGCWFDKIKFNDDTIEYTFGYMCMSEIDYDYATIPMKYMWMNDEDVVADYKKIKEEEEERKLKEYEERQRNIEKEKEKQEKITREKQAEIMKNVKIPEITKDSRIFIVDFILFNKNEKNILTEMKDMQILVADNNTNPFAKYLRGKKIGEIVIIPISEMVDQKLPKTDIFYKMTIKNIKKLTE